MDPRAQYMRPADLRPFAEHHWSRYANRMGRDQWDRLRDDIARNGFRSPAVLEYNHVTGMGFLGEGNHRLGIGFELDRAVPVVVHRTIKTAPEYPMVPITAPGQYSMGGGDGFSRFPELVRPADIGLPHVRHERDRGTEREQDLPKAGFEL